MSTYAVDGKKPVAAWIPSRDNTGNGTTTLTDLVGENNGTILGMTPETAWVKDSAAGGIRALRFSGGDDRVQHGPGPVVGTGDFSVSVWFYRDTESISNLRVFSTGADTNTEAGYALAVTDEIVRLFLSDGVTRILGSGSAITNQAWQHVVAVISDGVFSMFVNGVAYETYSIASLGNIDNTRNFVIGQRGVAGGAWQGRMDDLRIWNIALTLNDVGELYANGNGRGLVGNSPTRRRRMMMMQRGGL